MAVKKRYMKSDTRNVQPKKSSTQNFQNGSLERKLKYQYGAQARFDRETEALINEIKRKHLSGGNSNA